jgi:hypothetical protein
MGPLVHDVTSQGLHFKTFLDFEVESMQRPGEQENSVVHERHLRLQHCVTGLMCSVLQQSAWSA